MGMEDVTTLHCEHPRSPLTLWVEKGKTIRIALKPSQGQALAEGLIGFMFARSSLASLTRLEKTSIFATTHRWRCGIPAMSKTLVGPTHWLTKSQRWSMCSTRNLHGTERSR